mmetsp:Transcript_28043/g.74162  ORF Transcript_28043/g.74162 Transcript_28043/m.74162 type:complete len:515 (-) Transcript_28043:337-1881(-)
MSMLRRLLGKGPEALTGEEEGALVRLKGTHSRLVIDGGRVSTKSEVGFNACALFLDGLDSAARSFRLDPAPRAYRLVFTINYRALFPDEARNYRVDVLEASVEQYAVIWVNGDKFEFSAEAMHRAEVLQRAWAELCSMLERWCQYPQQQRVANRPTRSEIRNGLVALDFAWASFEHKYIAELIEIEEKARRLIVQAIEHEHCLQLMEATHSHDLALEKSADYREEQRRLAACVAHLNSVANFRGKGRDDLKVDILDSAAAILQRAEAAGAAGKNARGAAHILAADVVESFGAMRAYLQKVSGCLERVDPHLCNNAGLVAQLLDWEESWEIGARFVRDGKIFEAVSDLASEIQSAEQVAPSLTAMVGDCDVELFMALPRIIWLCFLAEPESPRAELLKMLLPHRFGAAPQQRPGLDPELQAFLANFRSAVASLGGGDAAWQLLVKRAVSGTSAGAAAGRPRAAHESVVEELMHELERWSIELQRHCPEDWNQCSAVLVQCLSGESQKQRCVKFQV